MQTILKVTHGDIFIITKSPEQFPKFITKEENRRLND